VAERGETRSPAELLNPGGGSVDDEPSSDLLHPDCK
jgi:hypothetical protein